MDCQPSQYIRSALSQCWGTPKGQPLPHSGQQTKPAAAPSPDSQEHYSSTGAEAHVRHLQASSRTLSNSTVIDLPLESTSNSLLQPVQQFEADHFSQHVDNGSSQHNGQPVAKEPSQQALDQSVLHRLSQQDASQSAFWVAGPAGQHAAAQSDQQLADQTVQHGSGFSGEPYDTLTNHHHHNSSLPLLTQSGTEGVWREHGQQELSHRTRSGSHAHKAGGFTSLQEYGFQALPVCGEDYTEAQALSSADLVCGMSQTNKAVLDGIR